MTSPIIVKRRQKLRIEPFRLARMLGPGELFHRAQKGTGRTRTCSFRTQGAKIEFMISLRDLSATERQAGWGENYNPDAMTPPDVHNTARAEHCSAAAAWRWWEGAGATDDGATRQWPRCDPRVGGGDSGRLLDSFLEKRLSATLHPARVLVAVNPRTDTLVSQRTTKLLRRSNFPRGHCGQPPGRQHLKFAL